MNTCNTISVEKSGIEQHNDAPQSSSRVTSIIDWKQRNSSATSETYKNEVSLIAQYKADVLNIILNDYFEDGMVSKSEEYIVRNCSDATCEDIKNAIMELYLSYLSNPYVLTGLLTMIGCIPYKMAVPQCPIMAIGLLQNRDLGIRDKAIQVFERWNSKAGIPILRSLKCDRKWLQKYVDKVIVYLERDGLD